MAGMGNKIFVGRLPQEASSDDLHDYFSRFGRINDVYVPKVINFLIHVSRLVIKQNISFYFN